MTQVHVSHIQRAAADCFGLKVSDVKGPRRSRDVSRPRQMAMYLCREMTDHSLPAIGWCFCRDHTTVLHAVVQIRDHQSDPEIARGLLRISQRATAIAGRVS